MSRHRRERAPGNGCHRTVLKRCETQKKSGKMVKLLEEQSDNPNVCSKTDLEVFNNDNDGDGWKECSYSMLT